METKTWEVVLGLCGKENQAKANCTVKTDLAEKVMQSSTAKDGKYGILAIFREKK